MRWGLLIALMVFHTILFSIGLRWWHVVLADVALMVCWTVVLTVRHHAESMFFARVTGVLFDLGINASKLDRPLYKQLQDEASACFRDTNGTASHHLFAVRFFISTLAAREEPRSTDIITRTVATHAIGWISAWAKEGKIPADVADVGIARLNAFRLD